MASEWPLGAGSYTCPCWLSNRNRARTQAEVHDGSRNLPAFADHDFSSHIQEAINHQVRRRKQFKSHIVCKLITTKSHCKPSGITLRPKLAENINKSGLRLCCLPGPRTVESDSSRSACSCKTGIHLGRSVAAISCNNKKQSKS